ncbi:TetR/AcrR family transcriptional regulator [Gordonia sp. DT219]|uniref:TetR/AcrR family transcriptional regulator n=1 Tax=Gordonia sp. DT219 TaxID=3416658 RepID=UPI003CF36896
MAAVPDAPDPDAGAAEGRRTLSRRPVRADAARNYDKLVVAAAELFHTDGVEVALDKVAAEAGVGIGTLYRHFPNRAALVEATFRNYSDQIITDGWRALESGPADAALTGVFEAYMATASTKRGMKEAILAAVGDEAPVFGEAREQSRDLMTAILAAGQRDGVFRDDIEPADLSRLVGGLSMTCVAQDTEETRRRMVGLVLDGLRPRT